MNPTILAGSANAHLADSIAELLGVAAGLGAHALPGR